VLVSQAASSSFDIAEPRRSRSSHHGADFTAQADDARGGFAPRLDY
jgi:hypothetical protein